MTATQTIGLTVAWLLSLVLAYHLGAIHEIRWCETVLERQREQLLNQKDNL